MIHFNPNARARLLCGMAEAVLLTHEENANFQLENDSDEEYDSDEENYNFQFENEGKRKWMKKWFKRRDEESLGSYEQLFKELREEEKEDFLNYCRMSPELFFNLLGLIEPFIKRKDTAMRKAIKAGARLEATLRWLASGGSYVSLSYPTRISKQSLGNIIPETCAAIYRVLKDEYFRTPSTTKEWKQIAKEFNTKWNYPHAIGSLDGKHVLISPPHNSGSHFYNYKGTHSIILLAMCNANYEFTYADIGINGRTSDAAAWDISNLKISIEQKLLNIPEAESLPNSNRGLPYCILADDAFPLKPYLMKPYSFRNQSHAERIFSYRLSRARRCIENAFGILCNRFRVLLAPINLAPEKVEIVVLACLALHNYLRRMAPESANCENFQQGQSRSDGLPNEVMIPLQRQPRNVSRDAKWVRDEFKHYFNNEGAVPWQDLYVNQH